MKILIDTSTLYSAVAFDGTVKDIVDLLIEKHTVVISDYLAAELRLNISSKVSVIMNSGIWIVMKYLF